MIQIVCHLHFCDAHLYIPKTLVKKMKRRLENFSFARCNEMNETEVFDEPLFWYVKIRARKFQADEFSISFSSSSRYMVLRARGEYSEIFCSMPSGLANIFQYRDQTQQTHSILPTHFLRKVRTYHGILFLRMQITYISITILYIYIYIP